MIRLMKRAPRTKRRPVDRTQFWRGLFSEMGYLSFRGFLVELTLIHIINLIHPAAAVKTRRIGLRLSPLMARVSGSLLEIRSDLFLSPEASI